MNKKQPLRRLLSLLLLTASMLSALPLSAVEFTVGSLTYTSEDNSTASVSRCDENASGELIIPESVEYGGQTYTVTSVGVQAFYFCVNLTSVKIPNSVISIGEWAFAYGSLTNIHVESGNPNYCSLDGVLFNSDRSELIAFPAGRAGEYQIPNSVTSISGAAFITCWRLTSVTIPNSVTSIGDLAFNECLNLTSVTIPNSVTSIGTSAFSRCSSLTNIHVESGNPNYCSLDGVLFNSDKSELITFPVGRVGEYQIPNSVTSIGDFAFNGCIGLTSVTIPNSVTSIGYSAFNGCSSLTSVEIPNSVTSIGYWAFLDCFSLTNIQVEPGNLNYCSLDGVLFNSDKSVLLTFPKGKAGEYQIPNSVTSIGSHAFCECYDLTSVTIPNSVTNIGWQSFFMCSGLTSVKIPNSVTSIDVGAFSGCTGLTSVTIPVSVMNIGKNVFSGCTGLQEIYLYGRYSYDDFPPQVKVYTYRECYSGNNAEYLDFLQPQHITTLMAGVAIDYSERFNSFDVDGYEIKSLKITDRYNNNTLVDIPLRDDGKYLVKLPDRPYFVSMVYFDPRAGRDITTTFGPYETQQNELLTIRNITTTQTTVSFDYEANEDASTDFSEFDFGYNTTVTDKKGRVTLEGMVPGHEYYISCRVHFKDGRKYSYSGPKYRTKGIVFSADFQRVTPTAIELEWSYDAGDAADYVKWVKFEAPDTTYSEIEGNRFYYCRTSLPGDSRIEVTYSIRVRMQIGEYYDSRDYEKTETFTLPALELNTVAAKATSNDCAIICAETNMSELETNCGFEWRRYDAPDLVPSNFVNCPVNNGMMAGKLMRLSSNTYYKYRPFYEDMNGKKTYGEWTAFGTADAYVYFEPTVYTYEPTRVAKTSAVITGYALGGSDDVIEQGFEYSVVPTSRAAGEPVRVPATGTRMTATLTDLLPGTTYSVRAYATTAKETTYGEEQRFTTEADEEQSAIEVVETVEEADGFDVYTLSGVCVRRNATDLSGLRPGIYIANGRKFIVR